MNLIFNFDLISIKNFSEARDFVLVRHNDSGDSTG